MGGNLQARLGRGPGDVKLDQRPSFLGARHSSGAGSGLAAAACSAIPTTETSLPE